MYNHTNLIVFDNMNRSASHAIMLQQLGLPKLQVCLPTTLPPNCPTNQWGDPAGEDLPAGAWGDIAIAGETGASWVDLAKGRVDLAGTEWGVLAAGWSLGRHSGTLGGPSEEWGYLLTTGASSGDLAGALGALVPS